jgi:hypothetical protein
MTPLRQRFIEDMQLRGLAPTTQRSYIHYVAEFAKFYQTSREHLSLEEIREYQLYMTNERLYSAESVNHFVVAARFLYNVTLEVPGPKTPGCDAVFPTACPSFSAPSRWPSSFSTYARFAIAPR